MSDRPDSQHVWTVAALTARIKDTLEAAFPSIWVAGEISDLARPQSGHVYLTLKDEAAQIRCVMWRTAASRLKFDLQDGQHVLCQGGVDVYPPRGSYQLVIRQIELHGVGALQLALRQLQERLAADGLFDPGHKKPLPPFPRRVALVTSPTGAAVRDFLEVIRRRSPNVEILVIPSRVQGEGAAAEIARAIETANRLAQPPDVLVLARGGGSLEDLWCFNEEIVVRAIFASHTPVVSAVGHEIDVTLSDLAADVRALTPTEAAEIIAPSAAELLASLKTMQRRLAASLKARASAARSRLDSLAQRRALRRPFERVHERMRRVDELELRASRAIRNRLSRAGDRVASLAGRLDSLSPLAVLGRGYSLTHRAADGQLVRDAAMLSVGEQLTSRLHRGQVVSRVESIDPAPLPRTSPSSNRE